MASPASQTVNIRVLVASTGTTYKISLHASELTVSNIRRHIAGAIPPSDQILLLGPPYKVPKDSTLQSEEVLNSLRLGDLEDDPILEEGSTTQSSTQTALSSPQQRTILSSTERTGSRRLFLFSRQALSESAPDPPPCQLSPMALSLPADAPGPSPLNMTKSNSASEPLHQALAAYERQFMLYLSQGRVLADGADLRLSACRVCVQEQAVMARALRAAVSNLSDHFNGATRTRSEFAAAFQAKTHAHASLLHRLDTLIASLANISLHPSLVSIARASGRVMETLLDTVPVERERVWAQQCQTSHQRLLTLFAELDAGFAQLGTQASREEEARQDLAAEEEIKVLWQEVEGTARLIRDRQAQRVERLRSDHGRVLSVIMNAIAEDSQGVEKAFTPLREMSNSSKDIVPAMEEEDAVMMQLMQRVADAKTRAMKRMKIRLREVSLAQSSIQRVLTSVGVLRDALAQQCENMVHLEHLAELPTSYRDFMSELRRRRAYGHAVTSTSNAMMERLASMRSDEVKAREKFLRGPGRHLMPAFYEIFVPTLATPPPLFTPQMPVMVEMDTIPDVGPAEVGESSSDAHMQATACTEQATGAISSASSLTAESQPVVTEKYSAGDEHEEMMASAAVDASTHPQQQEQLIVSADENSGADVIGMDPVVGAAVDAERKTLAYENAMLRQALERMGGKSPRSYLDEARGAKEGVAKAELEKELSMLRKDLQETKMQLSQQVAMAKQRGSDDKISHSSFAVGDVGLFMPTGRGSGGRRTYLAFHTNCPHRYLSTDCIKGTPDFVLGRIVYQEELVAGEIGTDANPFGLHVGTKFWVLTVEVLNSPQGSISSSRTGS